MADEALSVELEEDENDQYDEDEAIRAQANLNSPKGQGQQFNNTDDNSGMGLSLGNVDDEENEYDPQNATPNTKRRDQMDINSPRAKKKQNWDGDNSAAVAGLVTQVSRDDPNKQSGVAALVTQVPREAPDETERNIQKQTQSSSIWDCFSCLCCCGPEAPQQPANNAVPMTKQEKKQSQETANSRLLSQGESKGHDDDSDTDTEYPEAVLLPPLSPENAGKKCLVLDLDETLVHSSFKPIPKPDFIIPVEIDHVVHHVYVLKRPYVDEFLLRASKCYEIVIFTASLSKYADPLLDKLDIHNVIEHRLFRESCVIHGTAYVKDLRRLGRKLKDSIIVDNSPPSYLFQPFCAVPITSWFDDQSDTQLLDFCPVIETTMKDIHDVRYLLDANNKSFRWLCNQAHQPLTKYTVRNDRPRQ